MNDEDLCICGHRRDKHQGGMGECLKNGWGHGGEPACQSFRLGSHAPGDEPERPKPYSLRAGVRFGQDWRTGLRWHEFEQSKGDWIGCAGPGYCRECNRDSAAGRKAIR